MTTSAKIPRRIVSLNRSSLSVVLLLAASALSATPYDGIYSMQESDTLNKIASLYERTRKGLIIDEAIVPEFSTTFLSIQELQDGNIVLLKRNVNSNEWQFYTGALEGSGYLFTNAFNQTNYAFLTESEVRVVSEEIFIEFDAEDQGIYSHTLNLQGEFFFTGIAVPDDGRAEIVRAEPLTKIDT